MHQSARLLIRCLHKSGCLRRTAPCRYKHSSISVLGVPFSKGQPNPGVAYGPQKLRDFGILKKLEILGYKINDLGDLQFRHVEDDPPSWNIKYPRTIAGSIKQISDRVAKVIGRGELGLFLGGDHSLAIGSVHGHAQKQGDLCVLWVDAHADLNPPQASASGNIHGMVLSFLVHELRPYLPPVKGFEWIKPCIHAKDIAYIGLRDLDPAERSLIDENNITSFTMHDIDKLGIRRVLEEALKAINPNLDRPIHLSFDIDSMDPAVSPSTGTPVPGGLTMREGMYIAEQVASTGLLRALDLVEVNPELGSEKDRDLTLFSACEIIAACFGSHRSGNVPDGYKVPRPNV